MADQVRLNSQPTLIFPPFSNIKSRYWNENSWKCRIWLYLKQHLAPYNITAVMRFKKYVLTCMLLSEGFPIFNLCTTLINLSVNVCRMDVWTKIRLIEWTCWPSLWRKLCEDKTKENKCNNFNEFPDSPS